MRIAIIGAGPAGAMAAIRLARAGASVALFDPSHPREKPCGGGLTGRALALVDDVIDVRSLPVVVIKSAAVEDVGRTAHAALIDRGASRHSSLIVVSRTAFDNALVNAAVVAGARLIPERVVDIELHGTRVAVRTAHGQHTADHILGADGPNSLVRKKMARPFSRADVSVAAGHFVHDVTDSQITVMTTRDQPGYLWSFPRSDHLAVGVCGPAAQHVSSSSLRAQSAAWIAAHGYQSRLTPYAWPIPSIGGQERREIVLCGDRWMLLGDAAGLVDPLTREGIYYALLSGHWAADALTTGPRSRAGAHYAERVLSCVQPELARAVRLSRLFFTPAFSSLLVGALRDSSAIRDVFVDLVSGVQPYRGLGRRLLSTRRWALAARTIRVLVTPAFAGTMTAVASPRGNAARS